MASLVLLQLIGLQLVYGNVFFTHILYEESMLNYRHTLKQNIYI